MFSTLVEHCGSSFKLKADGEHGDSPNETPFPLSTLDETLKKLSNEKF